MELTRKQEEGLKIAIDRYHNHEAWTAISGYAGTGKSTLVSFIIDALGLDRNNDVAYVAYTGKASLVLAEKGCPNSTTAHKLLYKAFPRNDGTFRLVPKRPLDWPYKLIVVDEVSMLPPHMWELLLSHRIHVIALGDPFQLPPVADDDNGVLSHPHIFLDEVVRQAQESEIIRLSMDIRDGRPLAYQKGQEVQVLNNVDFVDGMYSWADQILCAKNETRYRINDEYRKILWDIDDPTPVIGDKVVCLHNDWDTLSFPGFNPLVNGLVCNVDYIAEKKAIVKPIGDIDLYDLSVTNGPNDAFEHMIVDAKLFKEHEKLVTRDNFRYLKNLSIKPFEYAYCMTVHKSQGSEYGKVLLLEEFLRGGGHDRWLYTGITRAINKLVIIKNYKR